ncbi:cache domain-containing protein [Boseongicola aestuarii]|uniref:Signal transduction histidine-protein kinase/phosphatase DegS n=1 Tax=Boseongicola aestuarii TaxID=1470561 RepID=A0A238IXG5_9RHOB|nr:cache domain-containing protein [Boseongicola aestuarii]SMX22450.1 Signal transduction histidine-protein kinase/phosphatase DegS [Boseongicola aestuarii]
MPDQFRINDNHLTRRYRRKFFLIAALPLLLAMGAIAVLVTLQSRALAEREIASLEVQLLEAKKEELRNYISIARTAIGATYGNALPEDEDAQRQVMQTLAAMIYGQDGYFFVFDYDGKNLVAPRQTQLINENWLGLEDANGVPITSEFIRVARSGGGYHSHLWFKPTTGEQAEMATYVIGLQDWRWVLGTGIFIDDIRETVAAARAGVEGRIERTFIYIGLITASGLLLVFVAGLWINIRERSLADAQLKQLTQRIIDTQEEERGRVARELHDGISQILISARYAFDLAQRRLTLGDTRASESLAKGMANLTTAIQEVRRISRDLRPGTLDDLGLGPALKALTDEFTDRTGIRTELETVVFRNRLDDEAKTALFRVAQEALTNIERHARASEVKVRIFGHKKGATLRVQDDGAGFQPDTARGGLGLRNMEERVAQLDGAFRVLSSPKGTIIEAEVPLSHLLRPDSALKESA